MQVIQEGAEVWGDDRPDLGGLDPGPAFARLFDVHAPQLAGALAQLNPADRDTLLLVSWAGLDPAEVAQVLGIPPGTVRSRLHRIRRWLRTNAPAQNTKEAQTP